MPFVYANAGALAGKPKVGSKECVALVQHYTAVGHTTRWVAGEKVLGNPRIKIGTAIATFRNGRYKSLKSNNHAAFFSDTRTGPSSLSINGKMTRTGPTLSAISRRGRFGREDGHSLIVRGHTKVTMPRHFS